jgi:hypothetical protein
MKNEINLIKIVFTFVLMNMCKNSFAQFAAASIMEAGAGLTVTPFNTGCDIMVCNVCNTPGDTMKVSVYTDGSGSPSPGIAWEVGFSGGGSTSSKTPLAHTSDILHADVCLIQDGSTNQTIDAIVAWYVGGASNSLYVEDFQWNGSGSFVSQGATYLLSYNWGSTLNIDGDYDNSGHFVIIYDSDGGSNNVDIHAITGQMHGGGNGMIPTSTNWSPVRLTNAQANSTNYHSPDVCFYGGSNSQKMIHFTYVDDPVTNSPNYLYVDDISWPDLSTGVLTSLTNVLSQPSPDFSYPLPNYPYYFQNPRIACPDYSGADNDWTVVAEENQHAANYYIIGYNNTGGSISSAIYYNDASGNSPLDLTSALNYLPVVTYDEFAQKNVWIGWNFDNSAPGSSSHCAQVQLQCCYSYKRELLAGALYYWIRRCS